MFFLISSRPTQRNVCALPSKYSSSTTSRRHFSLRLPKPFACAEASAKVHGDGTLDSLSRFYIGNSGALG